MVRSLTISTEKVKISRRAWKNSRSCTLVAVWKILKYNIKSIKTPFKTTFTVTVNGVLMLFHIRWVRKLVGKLKIARQLMLLALCTFSLTLHKNNLYCTFYALQSTIRLFFPFFEIDKQALLYPFHLSSLRIVINSLNFYLQEWF